MKARRSRSRKPARKRTKSRSRAYASKKRAKNSVHNRLVKTEQRRWNVLTYDHGLQVTQQQTFNGWQVKMPDAKYTCLITDTENLVGDVIMSPGNRSKQRIFVKGFKIQAQWDNCNEYPMDLHVAIIQPKTSGLTLFSHCSNEFFNNDRVDAESASWDFDDNTDTHDIKHVWGSINTDRYNVLRRFKRTLQPQATASAETGTESTAVTWMSGAATNNMNGAAQRFYMDKYFPVNSFFNFAEADSTHPTHPIFVVYWATQTIMTHFSETGTLNVLCNRAKTTLLWNET